MKQIEKILLALAIMVMSVFANAGIHAKMLFADNTSNVVEYPLSQDAYIRSSKGNSNYDYENITSAHGSQYVGLGYKVISSKYSKSDEIISVMKLKLPTKQELIDKKLNTFEFMFHVFKNPSFNAGDQTYVYHYSTNTNWDETTLTWNNKPAFINRNDTNELFRFDVKNDDEFEFKPEEEKTIKVDITEKIRELIELGIPEITIFSTGVNDSGTSLLIHSKETAPEEMRPKLIASFEAYTKDMLSSLVAQYAEVNEADYSKDSYAIFLEKLNAAKDLLKQEAPAEADIKRVYKALEQAFHELVSIIDPDDATNIAYHKPTRSNLSKQETEKVTDGKLNTFWKGTFYPSYVDIDLLDQYDLSAIKLFVPNDKIINYTIYGSNDGKNYDELYQKRSQTASTAEGDHINFDQPQAYRIIRIYMEYTKGENAAYVSEVRAYGTKKDTNTKDLRGGSFEEISGIENYRETDYAAPITNDEIYENIYGIVDRTIGAEYRDWFTFELADNKNNDDDYYEISDVNGKIHIKGNKGVSITTGLNYYYKNYLKVQISEQTMQVHMPKQIVNVNQIVRKETPYKVRYAFNYCTLSYTFAFFGEEEWQRENDWLALNGANIILDVAGQEATWIKFLMNYGYSFDDAKDWLVGPSYYAWQFMQNIETFGGPIPDQYVIDRVELARSSQRWKNALGMSTILQGYAGMVPTNINEFQPDLPVTKQASWGGLARPSMIATDSPYYDEYAKKFYEAQEYIYGATSDYYAVDPYHEGGTRPPGLNDQTVADEVLNSLLEYDENAVWVVQAWQSNPTNGLLEGMGDRREDHVLIIDLIKYPLKSWTKYNASEFKGTNWAWGLLGNFGGNPSMNGQMETMVEDIQTAKKERKHMVGLGIISEAQYDNPILYDLIFDLAWADDTFQLDQWMNNYIERRYGGTSDNAKQAWKIMKDANYDHGVRFTNQVFGMKSTAPQNYGKQNIPYGADKLETAFRLLIEDYDKFKDSECYRYDLTEIMRQMVSNYAVLTYNDVITARDAKDLEAFKEMKDKFLKAFDVVNDIQETQQEQLAGEWIGKARDRAAGYDDFSKSTFEMNAKALITSWASRSSTGLKDYAWRNYQGMFVDVYKQVWIDYLDKVEANLEHGTPITTISSSGYFDMYWEWVLGKQDYTRDALDSPNEIQNVVQEVLENCMLSDKLDPNAGNKAMDRLVSANTKHVIGKLNTITDGKEDTQVTIQADSNIKEPEVIIDLIGEFQLSKIQVVLDHATFDSYEVFVSSNKQDWTSIGKKAISEHSEDGDIFEPDNASGRYIKLKGVMNANNSEAQITIKEIRAYGEQLLVTLEQLQTLVDYAETIETDGNEQSRIQAFELALREAKTAIDNNESLDNVNTIYWTLYDCMTYLNLSDTRNLALKKPVTAHNDPSGNSARLVDGDLTTNWDSGRLSITGKPYEDTITPGWAIVDLGDIYQIETINLMFGNANIWYNYELYSSNDQQTWTKLGEKTTTTPPNEKEDTHYFENVAARYIKIVSTNIKVDTASNKRYSYAVNEMQVMGKVIQADKKLLEELLLTAGDLELALYTTDSAKALTTEMQAAQNIIDRDGVLQEEIDKAVYQLQQAINALALKAPADMLEILETAVLDLAALKDNYSELEFEAAQKAVDTANMLLNEAEKDADNIKASDVEALLSAIRKAKDELPNHSLLDALRILANEATEVLASDEIQNVRPGQVKALKDALEVANELIEAFSSDEAAIDAATNNLYKALHELYKIIDKSDIIKIIKEANALHEAMYTPESWDNLQKAILAANDVVANDDATKEQVQTTIHQLLKAIAELQPAVNKTALKKQLAIALKMLDQIDQYVPSSVRGFKDIIDAANAVYQNDKATQAEVNTAATNVVQAIAKARLRADKHVLENVLKQLQAIDLSNYTKESASDLRALIQAANELMQNKEANQNDVETMIQKLQTAKANLKKVKPTKPTDVTDSNDLIDRTDKNQSIHTGDTTNTLLWSMLMILGIGGVWYIYRKKDRKN